MGAFLRLNGHITVKDDYKGFEARSELSAVAKCVYAYLHELYDISARFSYNRSAGFLKRISYYVVVDDDVESFIDDLGLEDEETPDYLVGDAEKAASYLAGSFLAKGSVNDPTKSSYHLEIALNDESYAKWLLRVWQHFPGHPFGAKMIKRRNQYVLYLKKSEEISDFLILIGAKECCLEFENERVSREFSNISNRLSNLDSANYAKSLETGERQARHAKYLLDRYGEEEIDNEKLSTLMKIRIEHKDASLSELAELLSEELNTEISKSNVNHLLRGMEAKYKEDNPDGDK